MLIITTAFSVVGFQTQAGELKNLNFSQPFYQVPTPGYASIPPSDILMDVSTVREHPEKTVVTMNDIIISILEQIDDTTYLG